MSTKEIKQKPKRQRKGYFYEKEEAAVVQYIQATNKEEKQKIWNDVLYPAFRKMIESIIRRYKLYVPDEDYQTTFEDTMSYLVTKLDNFNPEKKFKAYSYCGTISKNYLLYQLTQFKKRQERDLPLEPLKARIDNNIEHSTIADERSKFIEDLIGGAINSIKKMLDPNSKITLKPNEQKVGEVLVYLLENWETVMPLDGSVKLNKSAVLYFLRENTGMTTKELRDNMKKFKKAFYATKEKLLR